MPDISKIQLPGSNIVYDIKDTTARSMASEKFAYIIPWFGTAAPTAGELANIPDGVVVKYNDVSYHGNLVASASTMNKFYLIKTVSDTGATEHDYYDEYVTINPSSNVYSWEKIGDTQIRLDDLITDVILIKHTSTFLTGLGTPTTANVIGSDATFSVTQPTISVSLNEQYMKATASGTTVGANGTADANKSDWSFTMGNTTETAETLIISGGNGTAHSCLTGVQVTAQPTVSLALQSGGGSGTAKVGTGIRSATATGGAVEWNSKDQKTVLTGLGTPSTASGLDNSTYISLVKG